MRHFLVFAILLPYINAFFFGLTIGNPGNILLTASPLGTGILATGAALAAALGAGLGRLTGAALAPFVSFVKVFELS